MGRDDIEISARAIAQAGSPEYTTHAGATLERLAELAGRGDLEALSTTFVAHVAVHPRDERRLVAAVPKMVLSRYLHGFAGLEFPAVERWRARTPDWAALLGSALHDPRRFAAVAAAIVVEVGLPAEA
ncbi:hypothetical protein [Sphingomonas corticis]|uniref:DUF2267 domain-containing protein n=1 Tax=Sphingomonas corticis TaxID=2722791 RepID=A0ABX1CRN1_9SPHN|nr:hypothetical protein [Sphingomonas corticis]NJR80594.1 hypothetical protein [Sphingomonas corticis]